AEQSSSCTQTHVVCSPVALYIARDLEAALEGPIDLVTASALLDLVSKTWLERLAAETVARSISVYATLSYDGRVELAPLDPFDASIVAAVNAHQRTDKGFGTALGPAAGGRAAPSIETPRDFRT